MQRESEVYRPILVSDVGSGSIQLDFQTTSDERNAVAERLDLIRLSVLSGDIEVRKSLGRQFILEGTIRAEVTQTCVVTGDDVVSSLEFPLRRIYEEDADPFDGLAADDEDVATSVDDEDPDPLFNGEIDAGEAAVEELALQIPPYPRLENAVFEQIESDPPTENTKQNPFSALASLKKSAKSND